MVEDLFVSIIVASYNYGRYLRDNLESLRNQTYKNFEVIVVDDGSTDNSLEIINEYIQKDSRFKLITHENNSNIGLTKSLEKAITYAKGDYVAFCESDDYWHLDHLKEKINYIKQYPQADVIACDFEVFGQAKEQVEHYKNSGGLIDYYKLLKLSTPPPRNLFYKMQLTWVFPTFSIVMVKINYLRKANFDCPTRNGIDVWLWEQLLLHCKIGYVDKKLTFYRRSGESLITSGLSDEQIKVMSETHSKKLKKMLNLNIYQKFRIKLEKKKKKFFSALGSDYWAVF